MAVVPAPAAGTARSYTVKGKNDTFTVTFSNVLFDDGTFTDIPYGMSDNMASGAARHALTIAVGSTVTVKSTNRKTETDGSALDDSGLFMVYYEDSVPDMEFDQEHSNPYQSVFIFHEPNTSYFNVADAHQPSTDGIHEAMTVGLFRLSFAPQGAVKTATAVPTPSKVVVDGKAVSCEVYNVNGNNYFKLRDLAYLFNGTGSQFALGWDGKSINLQPGVAYTPDGSEMGAPASVNQTATYTKTTLLIDGRTSESGILFYNINGNNYYRLADLTRLLDFTADWDGATSTITVTTGQ